MICKINKPGLYHKKNNIKSQDALFWGKNSRFSVISLADGASDSEHSDVGAEAASHAITDLFLKRGDFFLEMEPERASELIVSHLLYEQKAIAIQNGHDVRSYSSTVASVLYDCKSERLLLFNLGDGAIFTFSGDACSFVSVPSGRTSECCVTTTDCAYRMAKQRVMDRRDCDMVVICSDGAWRLMVDKNRLNSDVHTYMMRRDFQALKSYLGEQNSFDDYSLISMELGAGKCKLRSA